MIYQDTVYYLYSLSHIYLDFIFQLVQHSNYYKGFTNKGRSLTYPSCCPHLQNHGGRSDKPTFISTSGFIFESLLGFGVVFDEALTWPLGPYFSCNWNAQISSFTNQILLLIKVFIVTNHTNNIRLVFDYDIVLHSYILHIRVDYRL